MPIFNVLTLKTSCIKPYAKNSMGKCVSMAGKEYFQHAGGLQIRFHELRTLCQHALRKRLVEAEVNEADGIMGRFVFWVTGVKPEATLSSEQKLHPVLQDKKLLKQLKMQLKLFEICLRIFE